MGKGGDHGGEETWLDSECISTMSQQDELLAQIWSVRNEARMSSWLEGAAIFGDDEDCRRNRFEGEKRLSIQSWSY